jgi:hypothetical protein
MYCCEYELSERKGAFMIGKDQVERELRREIPLWRIEDELDWQENAALSRKSALLPEARAATVRGKPWWQPLFLFFRWLSNLAGHRVRFKH